MPVTVCPCTHARALVLCPCAVPLSRCPLVLALDAVRLLMCPRPHALILLPFCSFPCILAFVPLSICPTLLLLPRCYNPYALVSVPLPVCIYLHARSL